MSAKGVFSVVLIVIFLLSGCNLPAGETPGEALPVEEEGSGDELLSVQNAEEETGAPLNDQLPPDLMAGERISPQDLVYLGAFRLPEGSGVSDWDYSGHGLTYYPEGDPQGGEDGFPGSLFGIGHDHQLAVSEISIPAPVITKDPGEMNQAVTLQPFVHIGEGLVDLEALSLPLAGLAYLNGELHFCYADHLDDGLPTHGSAQLDLSQSAQQGLWYLDSYSNFTTCDYIFEIPAAWAAEYAPGMQLATGRFREGVWGGQGPALYAYQPDPEADTIQTVVPLLMYGVQEASGLTIFSDESTRMEGYQLADHWTGGAWLTDGTSSAVVFLGTKALGRSWYGFANGVEWTYDCAEQTPQTCPAVPEWPFDNRGYWAQDYQAQLIFFDTDQLGAVAEERLRSFDPQPYANLDLTPYLLNTTLDYANYKRDLVASVAFDPVHRILFVIERLADEYRSVVHVFRVGGE